MNDLNLSPRERIMFDTFRKSGKNETSIEDLLTALKKAGEKPKGGSRSLTVSVKYLAYKIAQRGYSIKRVSDLGRGNKASYMMERYRK